MPARPLGPVSLRDGFARSLEEGLDRALHFAGFCDLVECHFGRFDLGDRRDVAAGVAGFCHHLTAHPDQLAQQGKIIDLLGKILGRQ